MTDTDKKTAADPALLRQNFTYLRRERDRNAQIWDGILRQTARLGFPEKSLPPYLAGLVAAEATPEDVAAWYRELYGYADDEAERALYTLDFARFCTAYAPYFPGNAMRFLPEIAEADTDADFRSTAYLQNTYSDRAYRIFSAQIPGMTAEYHSSFADVCEEVYDNRCRYAILPLYTAADGRLVSFQKLLSRYDLKICMAAAVDMGDDDEMHFALLRKHLHMPQEAGTVYWDLSVVLTEEIPLGTFFACMEVFGAKILSVHTLPLTYASDLDETCVHLNMTGADGNGMAIFLEATHIRYTVDGIYSLLQSGI